MYKEFIGELVIVAVAFGLAIAILLSVTWLARTTIGPKTPTPMLEGNLPTVFEGYLRTRESNVQTNVVTLSTGERIAVFTNYESTCAVLLPPLPTEVEK